jgi:hypothetical protein
MHGLYVFFHQNHMAGVLLAVVAVGAIAVAVLRIVDQRGDGGR